MSGLHGKSDSLADLVDRWWAMLQKLADSSATEDQLQAAEMMTTVLEQMPDLAVRLYRYNTFGRTANLGGAVIEDQQSCCLSVLTTVNIPASVKWWHC